MQDETADPRPPTGSADEPGRLDPAVAPAAGAGDAGHRAAEHAGSGGAAAPSERPASGAAGVPRPGDVAPERVDAGADSGQHGGDAKVGGEREDAAVAGDGERVDAGAAGGPHNVDAEVDGEGVDAGAAGERGGDEEAAAGGAGAEPVPATGEPRVDAALRALDGIDQVPVTEHPAIFEDVHARIHEVLGELETGPATGTGSRRAG